MRVRHMHQRTRPFRYGGFWLLAVALVLLGPGDVPRQPIQVGVGVLFCVLWPWLSDRLRALGPAGDALRFDRWSYVAECALGSAVLAWASVPATAGFAATLCLLAGATALGGPRLLAPAGGALALGALAGAATSPHLTAASGVATDAVALVLVLAFALALAHLSFTQTERLHDRRRALAEKSAALERINGRMQRYLPPSLRMRVARAPDEPCRWERRWLTVVFVDLVGFTELSERLEAELLARVLDDYLEALVPAAEARGGEVSKLLGDGMLVAFGLRDPEERARQVACALDFCAELPGVRAALAEGWRRRGEIVPLDMRAGVASGFCTLGDRGGAERLDFTLIGPPVNLASRLQSLAGAGGVLLDDASAALAEATYPLGPKRMLPIKGLGRIDAYPFEWRHRTCRS